MNQKSDTIDTILDTREVTMRVVDQVIHRLICLVIHTRVLCAGLNRIGTAFYYRIDPCSVRSRFIKSADVAQPFGLSKRIS